MRTIPVICILSVLILVVACSKDKFETKPRIELLDNSNKELLPGMELQVKMNYFDKEGDLNQGTLQVMKIRLNHPPISPVDYKEDTFNITLPDFPEKDQGEITFKTDYERLNENQNDNDTIQYKFAVVDRNGNTSDTVTSAVIIARQN